MSIKLIKPIVLDENNKPRAGFFSRISYKQIADAFCEYEARMAKMEECLSDIAHYSPSMPKETLKRWAKDCLNEIRGPMV